MERNIYKIFFIGFLFPLIANAQSTVVKGKIIDNDTKEPLPGVNIIFSESTVGTISDPNGNFVLRSEKPFTEIQLSFIGYKTVKRKINPNVENEVTVRLREESTELKEVEVYAGKRERYRNKKNPAVDLVREMIRHKESNRIEHYDFVEFEQYEKLQLALSNVSDKFRHSKIFKKYKFLLDNVDTTSIQGKVLLPLYLEETITEQYKSSQLNKTKAEIKAHQKATFDDNYIDNEGITKYLTFLYNEIDIYDNNTTLLTNPFLSPIADNAPLFYKFYITDTITTQTPKLAELTFVPRNPGFLFQGKLYVTLDSSYAVQKAELTVSKHINLNWVRELYIDQSFEKGSDGKYHLSKSKMRMDFGLIKGGKGVYGERDFSVKDFTPNQQRPESFYEKKTTISDNSSEIKDNGYWNTHRHDSLSHAESKVYQNIDSLQKMPSFRRTMDWATVLLAGYKNFKWWELGPVNTFYSFNPVEGFKPRLGGRTTPVFSKKLYFETYGAYGLKDEKWKYFFSTTYSFNNRSIWRFPVNRLRVSYQYDTKIPGQELQFVQEDNFLLSFKRGVNNRWLYNNNFVIDYLHEFDNHFSFEIGFRNWKQAAAGGLLYQTLSGSDTLNVSSLTTSEFSLELRIAPRENFYQGKTYRTPIPNKYPIITIRGTANVKGLMNGQYNYQTVSLNIFKRVYLSQFGYTDMVLEGGYLFGKVPFPLLYIHRANQTYSYQLQSYNMMNFLEFASDRYASINIDHCFNGFFFNRIPLLKKLHWREVITAKVLYGGIRNENNPQYNPTNLLLFPSEKGVPATYSLQSEPYIEVSAGIANILNFFRIDVVKRLTYYNHPNVSTIGIRGRFKFDF